MIWKQNNCILFASTIYDDIQNYYEYIKIKIKNYYIKKQEVLCFMFFVISINSN